jgi:ribose transport system substrate-binding protein
VGNPGVLHERCWEPVAGLSPGVAARREHRRLRVEPDDPGYGGVQYSHNEPATASRLVTAALQKDPDIVGVFATNLFAAEGTATGIRQAGKQDQVKIVGFDAGPDQMDALEDGTIQALIAQQPEDIGVQGVQQAVAALEGDDTEPEIETGFTIITKDNLDGEGGAAAYKSSC